MVSDTVLRRFLLGHESLLRWSLILCGFSYFNQPRKDALIQGPKKKYPLVTGAEFTANAMNMYYSGLKAKVEGAIHVERVE